MYWWVKAIESTQFDFCGMSGSKVIAFFGRKLAAFLDPDLVLDSQFGMAALAEDMRCCQSDISNFCRGWKKLSKEPNHAFKAQLVQILQHFQNLVTYNLLHPVYIMIKNILCHPLGALGPQGGTRRPRVKIYKEWQEPQVALTVKSFIL